MRKSHIPHASFLITCISKKARKIPTITQRNHKALFLTLHPLECVIFTHQNCCSPMYPNAHDPHETPFVPRDHSSVPRTENFLSHLKPVNIRAILSHSFHKVVPPSAPYILRLFLLIDFPPSRHGIPAAHANLSRSCKIFSLRNSCPSREVFLQSFHQCSHAS